MRSCFENLGIRKTTVQTKYSLDAWFSTYCFLKFWICMHERDITSLYYACTESLHTCFLKTIRTSNWSSYSPKYHLHPRSSSSGDGSQNHRLQRCIIAPLLAASVAAKARIGFWTVKLVWAAILCLRGLPFHGPQSFSGLFAFSCR